MKFKDNKVRFDEYMRRIFSNEVYEQDIIPTHFNYHERSMAMLTWFMLNCQDPTCEACWLSQDTHNPEEDQT